MQKTLGMSLEALKIMEQARRDDAQRQAIQLREEPIVIALSGKKGAGKNTVASSIRSYFHDYRPNWSMLGYCECAFADPIKRFCIDVLGLEERQCHGTDEEKNTPTKYLWENTPLMANASRNMDVSSVQNKVMSGREVMQVFGTESVRAWFGNVWAEATLRFIRKSGNSLAVVTDNRFPSEVEAVLGHPRGYIVHLTRDPFGEDSHSSETALDGYDWNRERCFVLDNAVLSKEEQIEAIKPILDNIFSEELENE